MMYTMYVQTGTPTQALENQPHLMEYLAPYFKGWVALKNSRNYVGDLIKYIPISEIDAYVRMIGVTDVDEKTFWMAAVGALDEVYVNHVNTKIIAQKKREHAKAKAKR